MPSCSMASVKRAVLLCLAAKASTKAKCHTQSGSCKLYPAHQIVKCTARDTLQAAHACRSGVKYQQGSRAERPELPTLAAQSLRMRAPSSSSRSRRSSRW